MEELILASRSPRRRELLGRIWPHSVHYAEADIDEAAYSVCIANPGELVETLALAKAKCIADKHPDALVLGSDTVVVLNGTVMGKPDGRDGAYSMLRALSGRSHLVMSGVALIRGGRADVRREITQVRFRALTDAEIYAYIDREPPYDKAGAYGIQGLACLFIEGITGDYYNVMGLPLYLLGRMLTDAGYDLLGVPC